MIKRYANHSWKSLTRVSKTGSFISDMQAFHRIRIYQNIRNIQKLRNLNTKDFSVLQSRGPLWVLNTFEHDFVVKVVITWWHTWKKSFPHGSKLPALPIFSNAALTRQSLKFYHLAISLSEPQKKTFLCSLLGASKIWSSCNMLLTFWKAG